MSNLRVLVERVFPLPEQAVQGLPDIPLPPQVPQVFSKIIPSLVDLWAPVPLHEEHSRTFPKTPCPLHFWQSSSVAYWMLWSLLPCTAVRKSISSLIRVSGLENISLMLKKSEKPPKPPKFAFPKLAWPKSAPAAPSWLTVPNWSNCFLLFASDKILNERDLLRMRSEVQETFLLLPCPY